MSVDAKSPLRSKPLVGCDYHPGFQQIAFVDTSTGELQEWRLVHKGFAPYSKKIIGVYPGDAPVNPAIFRTPFRMLFGATSEASGRAS